MQVLFNAFFLVYVAMFGLSLFTFVGGMATTDADTIRETPDRHLNTTLYSMALVVIGRGLGALWLSDIVPPLLSGTEPSLIEESGPQAMGTNVIDIGVVVPSIFLSATWLFQERTWGFVFAGVELFLGATFAGPIGIMTIVFMTGDTVTISPVAAFFTFLPIFVSTLLAVTYLRSMGRRPEPSTESDCGQSV
jgi:hypothetical protein